MKEVNILELAKMGDAEAIASLINRSLKPKGIIVETTLQDGTLQIWLKSNKILDKQSLVTFIHNGVMKLEAEPIKEIKIYGEYINKISSDWTEEIKLESKELPQPGENKLDIEPVKLELQVNKLEQSTFSHSETEEESRKPEFLATLKKFKFSSVVPYKDALSSDLYNSNNVRLLLYFGLFPIVVRFIVVTSDIQQIAWILGIYYSSIWGIVLYNIVKPVQFSWGNVFKCVLFTISVGMPLLLFVTTIPPFSIFYAAISANTAGLIPKLIGYVLGVGVLEESCKALPIYLFLLRLDKLKDPLTSAFYGVVSGLGFAIAEGASYALMYANSVQSQSDFGNYLMSNTIRFVSLPLNHAIWAGIVGYFLGLAAINPSRKFPIIFIGVAISAVLHGFYDTFSDSLIGLGILTFSILLFVTYLRSSQRMVDEMQKAEEDYIASLLYSRNSRM